MKKLFSKTLFVVSVFLIHFNSNSQIISTVAGIGTNGFSGDGGQGNLAQINNAFGVAVDAAGNLYIADSNNNRIRKVNTSGIISTVVGTGTPGSGGDGGLATSAQLTFPNAMAFDLLGNMYIADTWNDRVRKVNTSGIISTIAGTGVGGFSGDGGLATAAQVFGVTGIAIDALGNIFITDGGNNRIRKINTSGIISTYAGNGSSGYSGDGGLATLAALNAPEQLALDASGNLYCRLSK